MVGSTSHSHGVITLEFALRVYDPLRFKAPALSHSATGFNQYTHCLRYLHVVILLTQSFPKVDC